MKFKLEKHHRNTPDSEFLEDLANVAKTIGKNNVTRFEYDEKGRFHSGTLINRFGTWYKALEKAGLEKTRTPMNLPVEELFQNLEELWVRLGRQPRYSEVAKPYSKYSVDTYVNRFGTWIKALEAFVTYVNNEDATNLTEILTATKSKIASQHKTTRNINWRMRFVIMKRDSFKCQSCGRSPATDPTIILHVDHIKAWANGGETVIDNLQTLCSVCNIGKSNL